MPMRNRASPSPHHSAPRRQLAALLSASAASTANGGSHLLPNGGTGSASASGAGSTAADAASAFESHLWPCLDRCFASHFRWAAAQGGIAHSSGSGARHRKCCVYMLHFRTSAVLLLQHCPPALCCECFNCCCCSLLARLTASSLAALPQGGAGSLPPRSEEPRRAQLCSGQPLPVPAAAGHSRRSGCSCCLAGWAG